MFLLSAIISLSYSDEFVKTICLCEPGQCQDDNEICVNQPWINPTSPNFIDDFNLARKNNKNIYLVSNQYSCFNINLDLRQISGFHIKFSAVDAFTSMVYVNFNYVSGEDYSSTNLEFEPMEFFAGQFIVSFTPIEDKKPSILKIGDLNVREQVVQFTQTELYCKSVDFHAVSLTNVTSLNKIGSGEIHLTLLNSDKIDIKFSKDSSKFSINDAISSISLLHDDLLSFMGAKRKFEKSGNSIKIDIASDFPEEKLPTFKINNIPDVEFSGKLWKPSTTNPLFKITNVINLAIPAGDVPIEIYSDVVNLQVSGDCTIYGDVDSARYSDEISSRFNINTKTEKTTKVSFTGFIDSELFIQSPYLDIDIYNYSSNVTEQFNFLKIFPIGFSFNEKAASHVKIREITFNKPNKISDNIIKCYPTISGPYTEEQLNNFEILKNGFVFLELPLDSIDASSFDILVMKDSPTELNNIPGFTASTMCMGVSQESTDRLRLSSKKVKPAYGTAVYLCLTKGKTSCNNPPGYDYDPYTLITDITDGDLSKYVATGYKEIYITQSGRRADTEVFIDFDKFKESGYNISIIGSIYDRNKYNIQESKSKIDNLIVQNIKFSNSITFNMNKLIVKNTQFDSAQSFTFSETTSMDIDVYSLNYLIKVPSISLNELNIVNDPFAIKRNTDKRDQESVEGVIDSIEINDKIISVCNTIKLDDDGVKRQLKYCSDISVQNIKKFNLLSNSTLNFEVVSFPENMIDFKIVTEPFENEYSLSLYGEGWDSKITNKIKVSHGERKIKISVSQPNQADNIVFDGKGSQHFAVNYLTPTKYCIYDSTSSPSCYTNESISTIQLENNDQLATIIANIKNISIQFTADSSTKSIVIPFSYLNQKQISLKTTTASSSQMSYQINFDVTKIDQFYSLTVFDGVTIDTTTDKDVDVYFGQMRLANKVTTSEKWQQKVNMTVSQLVCTYDDLNKFKNIIIDDQLNLTGDIDDVKKAISISFKPDLDPNDLVADIDRDITITIGAELIKIGEYLSFAITHSDNYDAYFRIIKDATITIDSTNNDNADTFPKFVIDSGKFNCKFVFKGTYPKLQPAQESYIKLVGAGKVEVEISSYVPVTIRNYKQVTYNLKGEKCSVHGPVDYVQTTNEPSFKFSNDIGKRATFEIINEVNILSLKTESTFAALYSSDIDVTFNNLVNSNNAKSNLTFIGTISNSGASKIIFTTELPKGIELSNKFSIISYITGKILNENEFFFVKQPEVIIQAKSNDIDKESYSFNYIKNETVSGRTHGFYWTMNCLAASSTKLESTNRGIQLFAEVKPSKIPFIIDFLNEEQKSNGELLIRTNETSKLKDLKSQLPNQFEALRFRIYTDMEENAPLDLNGLIEDKSLINVTVEAPGYDTKDAYTTFPTNKGLVIYYTNVRIGFTNIQSATLTAKFINFTDCVFWDKNKFKVTERIEELVLDVDSLNGLAESGSLYSFKNKLTIHSANVIQFTKDGWQFKENLAKPSTLFKATDFTQVTFETNKFCILKIDNDVTNSIHGLTLNSYSIDNENVFFEMSRGWGAIKELNGFNIVVHNANKINLNSASYPIPPVFDLSKETQLFYTFIADNDGKFDTITLDDRKPFNDQTIDADLHFLPSEYRHVIGNKINFAGKSEIRLKNGTVKLNEATIVENSNVSISKLEISNQLTIRKGALLTTSLISSPSSKITLHWTLNSVPLLIHDEQPESYPSIIEVIYDDESVDKDQFNQLMLNKNGLLLMKGNFKCPLIKNQFAYGGRYKPFSERNQYLSLYCEISPKGQYLFLKGVKEIDDDDAGGDDAKAGDGDGNVKLSSGGVVGIVIACVVIVAVIVAFAVYYVQRKKIDTLQNELRASNTATTI